MERDRNPKFFYFLFFLKSMALVRSVSVNTLGNLAFDEPADIVIILVKRANYSMILPSDT